LTRFADHRSHLARLRTAALRAVDPAAAVRRFFTPGDVADAERVFVVGAGKAGVAMAQAAAEILGERLASGVVAVPHPPAQRPERIAFVQGGHPTPTGGSLAAGRAMADLLDQTAERDLVVALISGGGSALLELPQAGISLEDLQATTTALLKSGATIHEVNTVRTTLSRLKGGGLARLAHPARVLGLIMSDVVGNRLDIIASGPTVPSQTTRQDALAVIEKYDLRSILPAAVLNHLTDDGRRVAEASAHRPPPSVENRLVASNRLAGEAAIAAARELGFAPVYLGDDWQGEAREVGGRFAEAVTSPPTPGPTPHTRWERGEGWRKAPGRGVRCFVAGGESTVTVRGAGRGGRNQEAALSAALAIAGLPLVVISTFATDGVDGPTDAAGAVVTGETVARARALGLDPHTYLDDNDAYNFFAALGDLVITGPTGTNVNDLMFGLTYAE
jgi:hydroxypyruvate reductase